MAYLDFSDWNPMEEIVFTIDVKGLERGAFGFFHWRYRVACWLWRFAAVVLRSGIEITD